LHEITSHIINQLIFQLGLGILHMDHDMYFLVLSKESMPMPEIRGRRKFG